jgi:NAD(P)-dependent dehydrogenase (short-subunit alcohol dehydrogenase family)
MLLENKVALVTGGARGIGRAIALKFAAEGCAVAAVDVDLAGAEETRKSVQGQGKDGLALKCDVTRASDVALCVESVLARLGPIDILVNNAGGMRAAPPLEEMSEELWDEVVDLNLKSLFLVCRSIVPLMKKRRSGKIINISSIGALNPPRHSIHYNSAKAGVLGFTRDLAYALAPYQVNVNVIVPGLVQTDFYNRVAGLGSAEEKAGFFKMVGNMVPLQRMGTADDIAGAALYLASDLAAYVTGASLTVSGGMPLSPQQIKP